MQNFAVSAYSPAAHAQTGYSPPGWYQEQLNFIKANNPAANCEPGPDPYLSPLGIDAWRSSCEARSVSYRGKETMEHVLFEEISWFDKYLK